MLSNLLVFNIESCQPIPVLLSGFRHSTVRRKPYDRAAKAIRPCGESHTTMRRKPYDHAAKAIRPCGENRTMPWRKPRSMIPSMCFDRTPPRSHSESLCPKFRFSSRLHFSSAFGAGMLVPNLDSIAATSQAESSHFCRKRMGYPTYSSSNDNVLNRMAVWTSHSGDMLSK